ncbi:MAG: hypothetical protein HY905_18725 [Deltaproteobacteria bacterium]|nr:hypothetical protein [Deltaproteobacteria bacterium]
MGGEHRDSLPHGPALSPSRPTLARLTALAALLALCATACPDDHEAGGDADAEADGDAGADADASGDADGGGEVTFTLDPIVQLSHSPTDSQTFLNTAKCVAVDGAGSVHVVWLEVLGEGSGSGHAAQGQLVTTRSTDGGSTFAPPVPLTAAVAEVGVPKIATAGTSLFVTWHQSDGWRVQVMLSRSDDGGDTWTPPVSLGQGTFPSIDACSSGPGEASVHVAWSDSQNVENHCEVYLANSVDGGRTFAAPVMVSTPDGLSSWTASVASWGATTHVAWTDERFNVDAEGRPYDCIVVGGGVTCHEEVFYRRSTDGGATFTGPEVRLTSDPPGAPQWSWAPSIVAWHDDVHIAYFDHRSGSFQLYYRRSRDAGATWETEEDLTSGLAPQPYHWWRPSLAAVADQLQLTFWEVDLDGGSSIWTMSSLDTGATWSSPLLLSEGPTALQPAVALSPTGTAHFVWYDDLGGNDEMFYRRLAAGRP